MFRTCCILFNGGIAHDAHGVVTVDVTLTERIVSAPIITLTTQIIGFTLNSNCNLLSSFIVFKNETLLMWQTTVCLELVAFYLMVELHMVSMVVSWLT